MVLTSGWFPEVLRWATAAIQAPHLPLHKILQKEARLHDSHDGGRACPAGPSECLRFGTKGGSQAPSCSHLRKTCGIRPASVRSTAKVKLPHATDPPRSFAKTWVDANAQSTKQSGYRPRHGASGQGHSSRPTRDAARARTQLFLTVPLPSALTHTR